MLTHEHINVLWLLDTMLLSVIFSKAYLSCSSPWWLQSWPCWVEVWVPLHRAAGWLAVNGSYSSGCSSVPRLSSLPLSSSRGLATSSSPPAVPSLHCPNMESYRGKTDSQKHRKMWFLYITSLLKHSGRVVVPSSREGGGHRGGLWWGATNFFPIRTSRWGRWGGQDTRVDPHGIIWVHCKLGGK